MKMPEKKEKTCRELYVEFTDWFKMSDISESRELSMIFTYLQHRCSFANGNYVHVPGKHLREIIERRMGHKYLLIGSKKESPAIAMQDFR